MQTNYLMLCSNSFEIFYKRWIWQTCWRKYFKCIIYQYNTVRTKYNDNLEIITQNESANSLNIDWISTTWEFFWIILMTDGLNEFSIFLLSNWKWHEMHSFVTMFGTSTKIQNRGISFIFLKIYTVIICCWLWNWNISFMVNNHWIEVQLLKLLLTKFIILNFSTFKRQFQSDQLVLFSVPSMWAILKQFGLLSVRGVYKSHNVEIRYSLRMMEFIEHNKFWFQIIWSNLTNYPEILFNSGTTVLIFLSKISEHSFISVIWPQYFELNFPILLGIYSSISLLLIWMNTYHMCRASILGEKILIWLIE